MRTHSNRDSAGLLARPIGPLYSHLPSFAALLTERGYSKDSIALRMWLAGALDR
jgi:hypothetical protein